MPLPPRKKCALAHEDAAHISPVDAAVLVGAGWLMEWPWEFIPGAMHFLRRNGYPATCERAREIVRAGQLGELTGGPG